MTKAICKFNLASVCSMCGGGSVVLCVCACTQVDVCSHIHICALVYSGLRNPSGVSPQELTLP